MLSRLAKFVSGSSGPSPATDLYRHRLAVYERELDEPERTFTDGAERRIDIHAFGRDFVPECREGSDEGYVLLTNGMSEQRMSGLHGDAKPRAELMWYVREPTEEICANLRWVANLPFIDTTWFGFGHRVALPRPPVAETDFQTFLFLTPIIGPDKRIAEALEIAGDPVEILTVNLISHQELALIKSEGLDSFLDLLDENDYPPIFDPARKSYV
ncbi:suppressor of fused domain protein [Bradyrhizobium liaoningense]|uniref:suppressor of fused domain protein n=1 Tax=Bradyrhizobium liaoningense TaxID=43992 RepID=UPI001BADC33E|nr:suppressor of fused domain protein [Bradyrhizobium liaoningense]MBR0905098.1 suppressor of fused domain protein [Bradyrhizobium liaoningense]